MKINQDQIVVLKNTEEGLVVDTVYNQNDTLFIDFSNKTTIEIPSERFKVETYPPAKSWLEIGGLWAVIIGGIAGLVGAFIAFSQLFKKSKNAQDQLDKLGQVSSALEAQNELMKEGNDNMKNYLIELSKQVTSGKKEENDRLAELEEKRLRISVKPKLISDGNGRSGGSRSFHFSIKNVGESCIIDSIKTERILGDITLRDPGEIDLEKNQSYKFEGNWRGELREAEFRLVLGYVDKGDYRHQTTLSWKAGAVEIVETKEL